MQLLLNISTLLMSLISLLTLYEMMKQRRASMLPNILTKSRYKVYLIATQELSADGLDMKLAPYMWCDRDMEYDSNNFFSPRYIIQLTNVGNGTATNIRYKWDFDIEYYLAKIYEKIDINKLEISYKPEEERLLYSTSNAIINTPGLRNNDYKIPFIQAGQTVNIELNFEFIMLYSTLYFLSWNNSEKIGASHMQFYNDQLLFPYPELTIKYNDISGKEYKKKFKINVELGMSSYRKSHLYLDIIEK